MAEPAVVLGNVSCPYEVGCLFSLVCCVVSGKQQLATACNTCWRGLKSSFICRERRYRLWFLTGWTGRCESCNQRYSYFTSFASGPRKDDIVDRSRLLELKQRSSNTRAKSHGHCPSSCSVICKYEFHVLCTWRIRNICPAIKDAFFSFIRFYAANKVLSFK